MMISVVPLNRSLDVMILAYGKAKKVVAVLVQQKQRNVRHFDNGTPQHRKVFFEGLLDPSLYHSQ